jgi:hypothetical protein
MKERALYTASFSAILIAVLALLRPVVASGNLRPVKSLTTATIAAGTTLASSRSFSITNDEIGNQAYGLALLYTFITDANDSETGVSLSCTGTRPGDGTAARIPACVWDATNTRYNCEAAPLFWNPSDETSPKGQVFRVDIEGLVNVDCTYEFTGGAAADSIEVLVDVATKG